MTRCKLIAVASLLAFAIGREGVDARQQPPTATFKAGVDLVRVAAVVREEDDPKELTQGGSDES